MRHKNRLKRKARLIFDMILISAVLLGLFSSTYYAFGKPLTLRHAVYRVFNDLVDRYSISDKKLTVVTDNFGWDGSGWSRKQAVQDGKRQIKKLTSVLPEFGQQVDRVEITVTYLKQPVMQSAIDN